MLSVPRDGRPPPRHPCRPPGVGDLDGAPVSWTVVVSVPCHVPPGHDRATGPGAVVSSSVPPCPVFLNSSPAPRDRPEGHTGHPSPPVLSSPVRKDPSHPVLRHSVGVPVSSSPVDNGTVGDVCRIGRERGPDNQERRLRTPKRLP